MTLALRTATLLDVGLCAAILIDEDRKQWHEFTGEPYNPDDAAAECWSFVGPKWAICDETGMALAAGGCHLMRPGVYQSWFLSGAQLWEHGEKVTQVTRQAMLHMLDNGAHRIETICLESRRRTRRWYEAVGLHFETVLPYYGVSGANAVQYAVYRKPEIH